ncbi:YjfB family protein [Acetonema longum]|uniref:Motility protein n=1 Tax=Acetonema longum DSM 6540 TaxID=1009370 RepID=F7NG75_9FIRM|nr:YjfB family protein [Acetonema longum]EGO64993.1 hypothetical protein ALO_05308 [Acetonema longum DSM 6540]
MDIAALSTVNSQAQVQGNAGILLLKKALDTTEASQQAMLNILVPPSPSLGSAVDVKA